MEKGKRNLLSRRGRLVKALAQNQEMVNAYAIERRCGKAGCKCQKGKGYRHNPAWCFHDRDGGKIKADYIPARYAKEVKRQAQQYKNYKVLGMQICEINRELLKLEIKEGK